MSDYTPVNDYSAKDALASGNPLKLIKGSDVDQEFDAIAVAIATKFDSGDLSSQGQAEAGTDNATVMTPLRTQQWGDAWADENAGIVGDLHDLADPNADRILFWDDSAGSAAALAATPATGGVGISGTELVLDLDALTNVAPATGDELVVADASDSGNPKAVLISALETLFQADLNHDSFAGFVANEHIDHSAVSISAGTGLTGGGTIAADRSLSLSHLGLEALTDPNADSIAFWDDSAGAFAWLTPSTGLSISGTTLTVDASALNATKMGVFYRGTDQGLIAAATKVQWNSTTTNTLAKGTMDLTTNYRYTASATVNVQVNVNVYVTDLDTADEAFVELRKNGSAIRRAAIRNDSGSGPYPRHISFSTAVALGSTDYLEVYVSGDADGVYVAGGASYSSFELLELP